MYETQQSIPAATGAIFYLEFKLFNMPDSHYFGIIHYAKCKSC